MPVWLRPYLAGVITALMVVGTTLLLTRPPADAVEVVIATPVSGVIVVSVSGEIAHPGVYQLSAGSRVSDLLEAAGGVTRRADPATPSRALRLRDEMHVHVPAASATETARAATAAPLDSTPTVAPPSTTASTPSLDVTPTASPALPSSPPGLVDINGASATELERLPGIGPALAGRIVADRERNGPFSSVDDLARVSGIGAATVERLRPHVTVGP